jgi:hypothetical protein
MVTSDDDGLVEDAYKQGRIDALREAAADVPPLAGRYEISDWLDARADAEEGK